MLLHLLIERALELVKHGPVHACARPGPPGSAARSLSLASAGCSRMRARAQRAPSARLAAMPAVISASSVARSSGPSWAITGVRPRASSSSFGASSEMPSIFMIAVGRRPAVSATSLVTTSPLTSGSRCARKSSSWSPCSCIHASRAAPSWPRMTFRYSSPGSITGWSPWCSSTSRGTAPGGKRSVASSSIIRWMRSIVAGSTAASLLTLPSGRKARSSGTHGL
jgi:hypothetical protein